MKKKIFCFDIDNTICSTVGRNYTKSKPKKKIIKLINSLYDSGHEINIFTARYMGRNKNNISKAKKQGYNFTSMQLKYWNLKYHKLFFGKPSADLYIDDKSLGFKKNLIFQNLSKFIKKKSL